jgi:transcriptional regulator with XRE-family HTH domain
MQRSDVLTTERPQLDGEPAAAKPSPARLHVITLEEFVQRMPLVQPPCAYRLSLDSGVEFNNVKHAFEQPMAVRLDTWLRREDVGSDDPSVARVLIGAAREDSAPQLAPCRQSSLQDCRRVRNLSMAALAHQIGVSIDTVTSVERGRGLLRNVARVCEQFGLRLFVALPGRFHSVDELWAAHAERYLLAPSQFPLRRPTRKFEAAAATPMPRRRTGPPRKVRPNDA